ncbi:two-component regulator propeller domain-containing protein [Proteiniphilum sp. X52]|uniref:hybrid sensor histidine kinase/response regulator transcription factor n=1 Tax=Proteiniphilum sp. X52 TaxID=2382159 RepID=UPI000F0A807C|nr:two-component regulator propeller domain-containing protein [Proteiniphilum sp. X52]RNC65543.1 hybrid sensor histidine kinase/response regulator [Proteiniphilum sp. X52]
MYKILLTLILLVSGVHCFFAKNITMYGGKEQGINELSSYLVNKFEQDSYGFIWIATDYGLNRYDGISFTHYLHNEKDSFSLLSNNVRTLMLDKDSTLWIGCNKGLQYYDPETNHFQTIQFPFGISPHIGKILQLQNGEIWVATGGWGLFSVDKKKKQATQLQQITALTDNFIDYFYEDRSGMLWFAIESKGLIQIEPQSFSTKIFKYPEIPYNAITSMIEDENGQLYISASTSVCAYDKKNDSFRILKQSNNENLNVIDMVLTQKGAVFVSTNGKGLYQIDNHSECLRPVTYADPSRYYYYYSKIPALMEDRDQNLWMGCHQKGLLMVPNEQTQFNALKIAEKNSSHETIINSLIKDSEGYIYCSTDGNGVYKIDSQHNIVKHFNEVKDIIKIYEDFHHTLWVSSYSRGLGKMDKNSGKVSFVDIAWKSFVKTMEEGKDSCLYISTFGTGFTKYNLKDGSWERYGMKSGSGSSRTLDNDWINNILCDSQGLIWLGHYKGISCFDPEDDEFLEIKHNEVLSKEICLSLMEDAEGRIWIGTYSGLFCLDKTTGNIQQFTVEEGLSSDVICGLGLDKNGDVWCSTFMGLNKLMLKENKIINYYIGNGLLNKIYNRWVYFQDNEGIIYFGGNNGITYFQPERISALTEYNYEILTTNLYVNSNIPVNVNSMSGKKKITQKGVQDAERFHFSYEDNTFTFEFSTMDYRDSENISFEYRINGINREWFSTIPGMNQITYHNLDPGKYTLEIRASKYGVYSKIKQLQVVISPPWYKTVWAFLLYGFIITSIGILIFNLIKKKRKEMINESKLQFFTNLSHEMRTPLTLLISPLEKLLQGDYDCATKKTLQGMYRNTNRLLALVNQILDIRRIDKGQMKLKFSETEMVGFIKEVYNIFEYQSIKRNIRFEFKHDMESLNAWIDRNNFDKILVNLLSNAFKFTPDNGEITIHLGSGDNPEYRSPLNHFFEINIIDSGNGIDESKLDKIFERFYQGDNPQTFTTVGWGIGLNLTRFLVESHHGSITASNRKGTKGSQFTVRIPLGKEHLKKEDIAHSPMPAQPVLEEIKFTEIPQEGKITRRKTDQKLLVVDDDEDIRDYLSHELGSVYRIITATDGFEALQLAQDEHPDLIISDVMMPKMDGITLLKKIKSNNNISHTPIILLTSKTDFQDRIKGLDKGADAYITKPFNLEELRVIISNLIENRKILKGKFSGEQDQKDKIESIEIKSGDELLMERVMSIINENIGNPELNVELLASKAGISRVQLHRKMKLITGLATSDFVRNIRMKHAAQLLREKKVDVASVAYAVGFINQSHFSTVFRKFYGVAPSEYASHGKANKEN